MLKKLVSTVLDNRNEQDRTIRVLMFGNSGIGKTSTLTAMYDQFNRVIDKNIPLQLIPDNETSNRLNKKLSLLKQQIASDQIRTKSLMTGTKHSEEFDFFIAKDEDSPEKINIIFRDFPGGYLETERKNVKDWVKESDVLIIPIDTPALIEENGIYNEEINSPAKLYDIFSAIRGSLEINNRLVIFVPLKNEKYLEGKLYYTNHIRDLIEKEFANLLQLFASFSIREKIAVVITSIQTLGGVKFSVIEKDQATGKSIFIFKKKGFGSGYSPRDAEQPLKYILTFSIAEVLKKRSKIYRKVGNFLNLDSDFEKAIKDFSKDYKQDHNFVILQGEELLKF